MIQFRKLVIFFFLLYSSIAFSNSCGFNLQYCGLSCDLDLSYKGLNSIKKLLSGSDKFVALTFDDGPSYSKINNILDALEKHESKATFFVLGGRINARTFNVIEKIHKAGHELGNHSWSHRKLTSLSSEEQMQELDKTNLAIKSITKEDVK